MDVTATQSATPQAASQKAKPEAAQSALSSDFETFLRMLTTQMQNQDPLNPMNSTEFASQLAQFSTVEQQTRTNDLLTSMASQLGILGMSEMAGWVGMEARTAGAIWVDDRAVDFAPAPDTAADRMAIVVRDGDDRQVGRLELAASDAPLSWSPADPDGSPLPAGGYRFELESLKGGEVIGTAPLETYTPVIEARDEAGESRLVLDGGITVAPGEITGLRKPAA